MENQIEKSNLQSNALLEQALHYRQIGWSPFPVKRADKTPLIEWKRFQSEAATEEEIRAWWTQYPGASIGIATGKVSGIIVVDIEAGGSTNGFSPTVTAHTGGGGWHLFYKHPGIAVKNSVRELAPLTDIRGDGGYVVVAPSVHKSGKCYEWLIGPEDAELVDLPKWILEKCTESGTVKKDWKEFPAIQVQEGARNDTAASYAGKLLHDLSPELWESAGWASLKGWNSANVKPPLPEAELRAVFRSIAQKESESRSKKPLDAKPGVVKGQAVITRFADIQSKPIDWLWPGRIARGKITLIAGDPGLGKSLIAEAFASHVSTGRAWPVDDSPAPRGSVILLSAEDDAADTIKPRLEAAGADCTSIHLLQAIKYAAEDGESKERMFSLKRDLVTLEEKLAVMPECILLVIDPISAYLDGTNSDKNSDVRELFAPLAALAARRNIAIILIQHLNKSGSGNALYRPMGSLAFIAAARTAYIVAKDKDNPSRRLLLSAKNNIAKETTGLAYSIVANESNQPVVVWESLPIEITANEALAQPDSSEERTETEWAMTVLQDILANGPRPVIDVNKEARTAGVKDKPLRLAREKLGVKTKKTSFGGGWVWALPQHHDALKNESALPKTEGILGTGGHLGQKQEMPF